MDELGTTAEVINALGGIKPVMRLTGRKYNAVWHWKKSNSFPASTYLTFRAVLLDLGKTAPASLWGMK